MPPKPKSDRIQELELRLQYRAKRMFAITRVIWVACVGGAVVGCFAYAAHMIDSLAGRVTYASIGFRFLMSVKVYFGWAVGATGLVVGDRERKLRREVTKKMTARIILLEKKLDPERTSSHLATDGTTNPDDIV